MDGANLTWIGIDVAKATLDLHFLPSGQAHSLANSPAGHRQLLKLLPKPAACRIVLEATGGYERQVVADLLDAGFHVPVVNPKRVPDFGQGTGGTLMWGSTTPVPEGVKGVPRKPEDAPLYNERAKKVMDELKVETNDLYSFALPKLKEIQIPVNVHFTPAGSAVLAEQVAAEIEKRLPKK